MTRYPRAAHELRVILASVVVVVWVLLIGSLAELDFEAHVSFVLGVVACIPAFVIADWVDGR